MLNFVLGALIRNVIPFLLQHQNLIANKHALFYRFDQKEKRDQTIAQFPIFAGFVTQEYYILQQDLSNKKRDLKLLENKKEKIEAERNQAEEKLTHLMDEYFCVSGLPLTHHNAHYLLSNIGNSLNYVKHHSTIVDIDSNESINDLQKHKEERNTILAMRRQLQIKLRDISSSVGYSNKYKEAITVYDDESTANISLSVRPFCNTQHENIYNEANSLISAIQWLNTELSKTPQLLESFESSKSKILNEIRQCNRNLSDINNRIFRLERITKDCETIVIPKNKR